MHNLPALRQLKVSSFSPNCLMGVVEALVRSRGAVEDLNRLFFEYSFLYLNGPTLRPGNGESPWLSFRFSRALPMSRDEFEARLADCYGLGLLHKGYFEFEDLLSDLAAFTRACEPVIAEVDLFHFPGQDLFGAIHDGHVILVTALDDDLGRLSFVDAFCGSSTLPITQFRRSFDEFAARRPYYLLMPASGGPRDPTRHHAMIERDLARSAANLDSPKPDEGLGAFAAFVSDLEREAGRCRHRLVIEGFWTFMCNAMQNARWLEALECGSKGARAAVDALRERMLWLNKRWFLINAQFAGNPAASGPTDPRESIQALHSILDSEGRTRDLIGELQTRQGELEWKP